VQILNHHASSLTRRGGVSPWASSARWPTALGQWSSPLRHSPGVIESSAQEHLDVGVQAAKFTRRPLGQGVVDGGINSQQYLFAFNHGL
jgi:hypothetical protein